MEQSTMASPVAGQSDSTSRPPYTPFDTVKNFLERLKTTGVPHRIDKTVMSNLSGATQSHLLLTLRYLRMIEADGSPSTLLNEMVDAFGTPMWAPTLMRVIEPAYKPILNGLDVSKATLGQLSELFRDKGKTEGTVTEKAIRFYLKALEDAGIKYSPHLSRKRGPRGPNKRKKESGDDDGRAAKLEDEGTGGAATPPPAGMIVFPIYFNGKAQGKLIVPSSIDESDVAMLKAQISVVSLYAKQQKTKGDKG